MNQYLNPRNHRLDAVNYLVFNPLLAGIEPNIEDVDFEVVESTIDTTCSGRCWQKQNKGKCSTCSEAEAQRQRGTKCNKYRVPSKPSISAIVNN